MERIRGLEELDSNSSKDQLPSTNDDTNNFFTNNEESKKDANSLEGDEDKGSFIEDRCAKIICTSFGGIGIKIAKAKNIL